MDALNQAATLTPKPGKIYLCRYGWRGGQQLVLYLRPSGTDGYVARKWRSNSGRWTGEVVIAKRDLVGRASADDYRRFGADVSKL